MNNAKNITISFIGGGSRDWAPQIIMDLAQEPSLGGTVRLYDIDHHAAENNVSIGQRIQKVPGAVSDWKFEAPKTAREALEGADFVIISILVGDFEAMQSDIHGPEKYGIYQSVGDTAGPGGLFRALRTVPVFAYYAKMIERYCPNAWVLNYTNPMSMCTRALYRAFPGIRAIGCCHEVFEVQHLLMDVAKEEYGLELASIEDVKVNVQGLNHFTWITSASADGKDLMPAYRHFAERYCETGYEIPDAFSKLNKMFQNYNRVKFDLFLRFGAIAAAGDRHLAEFVPYRWYMQNPEVVDKWGFGLTPVSWRKQYVAERNQKAEALIRGERPIELKKSGEDAVVIMRALLGLQTFVTNVNLPNMGQLQGLPLGAVVETNAYLSRDSVAPIWSGTMQNDILQLTLSHALNYEETVTAAIEGDKERARKAFITNPQIELTLEDANALFDEMYEHTKVYNKPYTGNDAL